MSNDINTVVLVGRLTRDAELRHTQSGTAVASFSLANNYSYKSDGDKKEYTSYFNCVAWAGLGEIIAKYCTKGKRIGVTGRLQQRSWEDKDGNKRYAVEIVVDNFQFLDTKTEGKAVDDAPPVDGTYGDSDIPF